MFSYKTANGLTLGICIASIFFCMMGISSIVYFYNYFKEIPYLLEILGKILLGFIFFNFCFSIWLANKTKIVKERLLIYSCFFNLMFTILSFYVVRIVYEKISYIS